MKLVTVTNHCALGSSYTKQSNQTSLTEDACSCEDQNGCTVSLACLQQDFGEIEWENHVRVVVIETARDQRKHKRQRRSTEVGSREETLVARGEEPTPVQSPLDQLFEKIYESIDKHTWEDAKTNVQKLQQLLTVNSGRESRARGGWKYSCDFILDTVLFADLLCRLQDDADVMTEAVNSTLGLVKVVWCVCLSLRVWEILGLVIWE